MQRQLQDVARFHRAIGAPASDRPRLLDGDTKNALVFARKLQQLARRAKRLGTKSDTLIQRLAMVLEELAEWLAAHGNRDLVAASDAWGDRMYLLLGDAVAAGLPASDIFREIHRSNMTKADHPAGRDGKAQKAERFRTPDLRSILERHPRKRKAAASRKARTNPT